MSDKGIVKEANRSGATPNVPKEVFDGLKSARAAIRHCTRYFLGTGEQPDAISMGSALYAVDQAINAIGGLDR